MNLDEYRKHLLATGSKVVSGSRGTLWVSHERISMLRQPAFALHVPTSEEVRAVFRQSRAAVLSFAVMPSEVQEANSRLYVCSDSGYSLERLEKGPRHDVRRGLEAFDIKFLEQSEIVRMGREAYRDTLVRTGQSFENWEQFEGAFCRCRPENRYLGALRGDHLAAFMIITEVEDWVSIGGYSANEFLPLCPNNALLHFILDHYLVLKKLSTVNYGFSSIQSVSNSEGLHKFKVKMGFEPVQVHRVFVINPILRPFLNRVSWVLVNGMRMISPRNSALKKAEGVLRTALQLGA